VDASDGHGRPTFTPRPPVLSTNCAHDFAQSLSGGERLRQEAIATNMRSQMMRKPSDS